LIRSQSLFTFVTYSLGISLAECYWQKCLVYGAISTQHMAAVAAVVPAVDPVELAAALEAHLGLLVRNPSGRYELTSIAAGSAAVELIVYLCQCSNARSRVLHPITTCSIQESLLAL
jgi:hypothetical protein